MDKPALHFAKHVGGQPNIQPSHGDLFNRKNDKQKARSIIREAIQNVIDAKSQSGTPHVIFSKTTTSKKAVDGCIPGFTQTAKKHFKAAYPDRPFNISQIHWLCIEDYNTTGLTGDIRQVHTPRDSQTPAKLYYFFQTDGNITDKGKGSLGTRGIGKAIYTSASELKFFLATTTRSEQPRSLAFGRMVLKEHALENEAIPRVFRGQFGVQHGDITIPITQETQVQSLHNLLQFRRTSDTNGLSIAIPFSKPLEIDQTTFTNIICEEYAASILEGKLVVEIKDNDQDLIINQETILTLPGLTEKTTNFMQFFISSQKLSPIILPPVQTRDDKGYAQSIEDCQAIQHAREVYQSQGSVKLCVPFHKETTKLDDSSWSITYRKLAGNHDPINKFIRSGLDITNEPEKKVHNHDVLVQPIAGPLTDVLASAEDPAHTKFNNNNEKFEEHKDLLWLLTYARRLPLFLGQLITPDEETTDHDAFTGWFDIPTDKKIHTDEDRKEQQQERNEEEEFGWESTDDLFHFNVSTQDNSVSVAGTKPFPKGTKVIIEMAYAQQGKDFGSFLKGDFDLHNTRPGPLPYRIQMPGITLPPPGTPNIVEFTIREPDTWKIKWANFDLVHRDINVRAKVITP